MTGKELSKKWNVPVKQALYRESGDWYHQLKRFPGGLFDKNGYVLFETENDFKNSNGLQIQKDVHVKKGISSIIGYVQVLQDEELSTFGDNKMINSVDMKLYYEGKAREVKFTKYERNVSARKKCLQYYGAICSACRVDLCDTYGIIAKGIIHVHHLLPIASIGKEYIIDPIRDMRPLCPNCHAIIHSNNHNLSIEELQRYINIRQTSQAS